ncbi:MAG: hypothetical protein IIY93_03695 [Clostridia bacterium]|nr:hypothetical protein [Clostridia bacterium]MBQ1554783.1 hypothetical protein [Clostridia bacterium]MBQ4397031.1 hypothetical protein [Clostridia bacterium]
MMKSNHFMYFYQESCFLLTAGLLSLSLTGWLAVAAAHMTRKRRDDYFSACSGMMIFICAKNIVTDCGWSFAALFGVPGGLAAQLCMMWSAFLFFRISGECCREDHTSPEQSFSLGGALALVCLLAGRHWLMPDNTIQMMRYWLGEAIESFLLSAAVLSDGQEIRRVYPSSLICGTAAVLTGKGGICAVLSLWKTATGNFPGEFAGAVLMTVGTAGLICVFVQRLKTDSNVTAGGFAAGLMTALVTASLFG